MQPTAVDLFCGTGGLSLGLERAGIDVRAGVDVDPECHHPYEHNVGAEFVEADVTEFDRRRLERLFDGAGVRVLAGCAPCRPFSTKNTAQSAGESEAWGLLEEMGRLVRRTRPEIVVTENVTRLRRHDVYSWFVDTLQKSGYHVSVNRVHSEEYGVPQTRHRLVVLASRLGDIEITPPTHTAEEEHQTVRDAIGDLPPIRAGEVHPDDPLHRAAEIGETNQRRLSAVPEGGNIFDIPPDMRPESKRDLTPGDDGFLHSYARMSWDDPAPAVSTQFYRYGTGPYGHPDESQHRALSLREGARIQTFPDEYLFVPPDTDPEFTRVGRLIGNAVPPKLAAIVGESITSHVEQNDVTPAV